MQFKADVKVTLKSGVLDPQGTAVHGALRAMGYAQFAGARVGRHVELWLEADSESAAQAAVAEVGKRLLANPVLETFTVELTAHPQDGPPALSHDLPAAGSLDGADAGRPGSAGSAAGDKGV